MAAKVHWVASDANGPHRPVAGDAADVSRGAGEDHHLVMRLGAVREVRTVLRCKGEGHLRQGRAGVRVLREVPLSRAAHSRAGASGRARF